MNFNFFLGKSSFLCQLLLENEAHFEKGISSKLKIKVFWVFYVFWIIKSDI